MQNYGVRFPYNPINLICMHVSTLLKSTIYVKKHEIAARVINVWVYTEILPIMEFLCLFFFPGAYFYWKLFSKKALLQVPNIYGQ